MEVQLKQLCELLSEVLDSTRRHLMKKQTLTVEEMRVEYEAEERAGEDEDAAGADDDSSDSDDEAPIYNPKGVPLGWDGKPIPYWLYKLHMLDKTYSCEICGNKQYQGPRAFERHFSEGSHSYGMRCLGIPNTKHFHGVIKINDAMALFERLKEQVTGQQFMADRDEEYEDTEGNVLNKQVYEDLSRAGLL